MSADEGDEATTRDEVLRSLYETVLSNIENDAWNAGRGVPISVQEYAGEALRVGRGLFVPLRPLTPFSRPR